MMFGYFRYRMKAVSRYDLHSPFIFSVYSNILKDSMHYQGYDPVEKLRVQLLMEPGYIKMCDLGAKSFNIPWNRKIVPLRHIINSSAVTQRFGRLLFRLVQHFKPATILEFGTSVGISTAYMALGNPESNIISIEGCSETLDMAEQNFQRMKLSNIRTVYGNFDTILPALLKEIGTVDLVFIDGNHREEPTLNYFQQLLPHLSPDTILVFDDIHWSTGMNSAWKKIKAHPSVKVTIDLFQCGMVFFREGLSKEDFIIRF